MHKCETQTSKQHQTTVICSLHQVDYGLEFADRIIAMRDGKIAFDGAPHEVSESELKKIYGQLITTDSAPVQPTTSIEPELVIA